MSDVKTSTLERDGYVFELTTDSLDPNPYQSLVGAKEYIRNMEQQDYTRLVREWQAFYSFSAASAFPTQSLMLQIELGVDIRLTRPNHH